MRRFEDCWWKKALLDRELLMGGLVGVVSEEEDLVQRSFRVQ